MVWRCVGFAQPRRSKNRLPRRLSTDDRRHRRAARRAPANPRGPDRPRNALQRAEPRVYRERAGTRARLRCAVGERGLATRANPHVAARVTLRRVPRSTPVQASRAAGLRDSPSVASRDTYPRDRGCRARRTAQRAAVAAACSCMPRAQQLSPRNTSKRAQRCATHQCDNESRDHNSM